MLSGTILHYEIVGKLGEGGMGVVYKARDTRLHRFVALKFLPPTVALDEGERLRFLQEARAASALDHPNICTIYDVERTDDGQTFIVMACYEGETLRSRVQRGSLAIAEAVGFARQIALGLGRAHERGIVHRDVKPANVFVTHDGIVKVLDFGLAKIVEETHLTRLGTAIGTVGYMSPEQARGEPADARADVWALGVILHEMLTGKPAFTGDRTAVVLHAIETREPASLATARPEVPPALAQIVDRALRKNRQERQPDANVVAASLAEVDEALRRPAVAATSLLRRPAVLVPLSAVALALVGAIGWLGYRANRASWARNEALPQIARLAEERKYVDAVALASQAERYLPGDPVLTRLWADIAVTPHVESSPSGALVEVRAYADPAAPWQSLGTTPMTNVRLPRSALRWRFSHPTAETIERAVAPTVGLMRVDLPAAGSVPDGFVKIARSSEVLMLAGYGLPQELTLGDYFIQQYEVTNRAYKKFVEAGGYRRKELWRHAFTDKDRTLTWDEAMLMFRDKAGQPGPATWEIGAYPAGSDDMPVGGISWFEAAAYAEFAGLSLPTLPHWYRAAGITAGAFLIPAANFGYQGPRTVLKSGAMSPSGAFDMAGNVKEWVSNATSSGQRYILGGGWSEPEYMFGQIEAKSPFDRAPQNGLRCAKFEGGAPDGRSAAPFDRLARDYSRQPVDDATFAQFARMQQYPPAPLDARVEKIIDGEETRVERVTFAAAYPGERVIAYVWLPKGVKPPYQALVVFPGAEALRPAGPDLLEQPDRYDFVVRSGRVVIHPVYYNMYERNTGTPMPANSLARRDNALRWVADFHRTIDYLVTRQDVDRERIAYFGLSLGAGMAPVMLATEPARVRLALLMGGGLPSIQFEPEVDAVNFAPRVKQPLLLVTGKYDYFIPYDTAQKRFFELIGTAPEHKRHVAFDAGHSVPRSDYLRELLGWLDKYFGPAK